MNNIAKTFQRLKETNRCACIPFVDAGDPTLAQSKAYLIELANHGADMLLIGFPFSDPAADGPIIQAAHLRALSNPILNDTIFQMIEEVSQHTTIPLLCQLYFNQIFTYGIEVFINACKKSGIQGLIIPDLPLEHQDEILPFAQACDIAIISMVTPCCRNRIDAIAKQSSGFLYCLYPLSQDQSVSLSLEQASDFFQALDTASDIPKVLGVEQLTPAQLKECRKVVDGIIISSDVVNEIAKITQSSSTPKELLGMFASYANACHD